MQVVEADRTQSTLEEGERRVSIAAVYGVLRNYFGVILVVTAIAAVVYVIGAVAVYLLSPPVRVTSLPFRFDFEGASRNQYPNGTKFNASDVIATPVLQRVHAETGLAKYVPYHEFSRSVFLLESNREYDLLAYEYQSRLADARLTAVDRDRLTNEYRLKLESLQKSNFVLTYVCTSGKECPPQTVINHALPRALNVWATSSVAERRVLLYRAPVITTNVIKNDLLAPPNLASFLVVRQRILEVLDGIRDLTEIPGAELIRTKTTELSYPELAMQLQDVLRFRLEPLIDSTAARSVTDARAQLESQLAFDQMHLDRASLREQALFDALAAYENDPRTRISAERAQTTSPEKGDPVASERVTAQIDDSLFDRIITLADRNADRTYRQRLVDEIREASLDRIPWQAAVAYDKRLLDRTTSGTVAIDPDAVAAQWTSIRATVTELIDQTNELYRLLSQQMFPHSLYSMAGPTSVRVERKISPIRLAATGILVVLSSMALAVVGAFIHNNIASENATSSATTGIPPER